MPFHSALRENLHVGHPASLSVPNACPFLHLPRARGIMTMSKVPVNISLLFVCFPHDVCKKENTGNKQEKKKGGKENLFDEDENIAFEETYHAMLCHAIPFLHIFNHAPKVSPSLIWIACHGLLLLPCPISLPLFLSSKPLYDMPLQLETYTIPQPALNR